MTEHWAGLAKKECSKVSDRQGLGCKQMRMKECCCAKECDSKNDRTKGRKDRLEVLRGRQRAREKRKRIPRSTVESPKGGPLAVSTFRSHGVSECPRT